MAKPKSLWVEKNTKRKYNAELLCLSKLKSFKLSIEIGYFTTQVNRQ